MKSLITKSFGFFKMTKFFDCKFSMISRLIISWQDKEFMKICGSFMIVRMTLQYTICGDNEISDYKIPFIFKIYNIINNTQVMITWNIMTEQDTICGYREYCDYKISSVFVICKMIKQYTICEDIIDILELLCCTHSVGLYCWKIKELLLNLSIVKSFYMEVLMARDHWLFHDGMS